VPFGCKTNDDCADRPYGRTVCDSPAGTPIDAAKPSYFCVGEGQPDPCSGLGERDAADRVLYPGRCGQLQPKDADPERNFYVSAVGIGAFATDVIWQKDKATEKERLFIPVRGDSTLHWIDVQSDGTFYCGQNSNEDGNCDAKHRAGYDKADNLDSLRQPPEPYAVDATGSGEYIALTNQTQGSVSLFTNDWTSPDGPKLVSILGNLPLGPVALAALPQPEYADPNVKWAPGFLVGYRTAAQIDLLRVRDDGPTPFIPPGDRASANYNRFALQRTASVPINPNSTGFDSRGIAIDDRQRQRDYANCKVDVGEKCASDPNPLQCCYRAVHQPDVFVASRAPASLLVGAMTADPNYLSGTSELPSFTNSIALTFGPSRVIVGEVRVPAEPGSTPDGDDRGPYKLERRIFIVCFDSRRIYVYDPKRGAIEATISTGRGPYALAVDGARGLAYLGHFTDSYLAVVSLDQRFPQTYAAIVASIGTPKAPRSSK